jgi:hypothetical protein
MHAFNGVKDAERAWCFANQALQGVASPEEFELRIRVCGMFATPRMRPAQVTVRDEQGDETWRDILRSAVKLVSDGRS